MCVHLAAYTLYLAGTIFFYVTFLKPLSTNSPKRFFVDMVIKSSCSSLSQIILSYVFWNIEQISNQGERESFISRDSNKSLNENELDLSYAEDILLDIDAALMNNLVRKSIVHDLIMTEIEKDN